MTYNDIIGTIGFALILLAYFLNTARLLPSDGKAFYVMNVIGAAMAGYSAYYVGYFPFVFLLTAWAFVSIYGLMRAMKIRMT